jgi:hypothetical protein
VLLEQCTISSKTPRDGKLEISPDAARRLAMLGAGLHLAAPDGDAVARLSSLECTCLKAAEGRHLHHFIESDSFRSFRPGATVRLELDSANRRLRVEEAP